MKLNKDRDLHLGPAPFKTTIDTRASSDQTRYAKADAARTRAPAMPATAAAADATSAARNQLKAGYTLPKPFFQAPA